MADPGIGSKQCTTSLCSSNQVFFSRFSFKWKWWNHTIVLTRLQLNKIPILFLSERSDFHMIVNQSVAVYALLMRMLTLLSVNGIFRLRFLKWSSNFRGFPLSSILMTMMMNTCVCVCACVTVRLGFFVCLYVYIISLCNFKLNCVFPHMHIYIYIYIYMLVVVCVSGHIQF